MGQTKELSIQKKTVDLHRAAMGCKNIKKKLGEKMTTAVAFVQKWKKYEMTINRSMQDVAPWGEYDQGGCSAKNYTGGAF